MSGGRAFETSQNEESITLEFAIIFLQQLVIRNVMDQADLGIFRLTRSSPFRFSQALGKFSRQQSSSRDPAAGPSLGLSLPKRKGIGDWSAR
jgi:hypothetical protein